MQNSNLLNLLLMGTYKGFTKNTKMDRKIGYFVFFVLVFLCELCGLSFYEKAMLK